MALYRDLVVPDVVRWVESSRGPLIAIPEAVLPFWAGAEGDETSSDHDRACVVTGDAGLLPVGDSRALVLPEVFTASRTATAFLPEYGTFVRRPVADPDSGPDSDSGAGLLAEVPGALEAAVWQAEMEWRVPGPVVLFDAARPGNTSLLADHVRAEWEPGRYGVRATHVSTGQGSRIGLVQVRRLTR
ncbi:Imm21 family immunity protein [Streptomyces sp. NPDC002643]